MSRRTTASKPSVVRTLDENVSFLPDSIEDFTKKTPLHPPGPEYDGPSQSLQDSFICLLALWKYLGDFITILEYSFTCTGQNPTHWRLKSHMVELGSYYEIPELNHLGRKKRIAVVFQRYFVELSNSALPYLPFCQKLDLLVRDDSAISAALTPSTTTAATATTTNTTTATTTTSSSTAAPHTPPTPAQVLLATPIPTKVNAFPKDVKWIIVAKAVFSETTGKPCGEISGLCVLEFELETLPAVDPPSPPPSIKGLTWRATEFSYLLNVLSAEQEYSTSPLESAGGHHANSPRLQHELTLKLGIDDTSPQSYLALREPRNDYKDDPTAFSMNSVEKSTECSLQGLQT
ncbi:hypothetical protein BGZ97_007302 [Linnemannia gamsii]|uniref:Uncharacterized protein n=1 Tax=Linnemannia gamsii TaxID=64522 RepID=A0A9P6RD89_9FUNG|nr:hypothetical protein BGZ97_007302 [Linnemannia gamsii]